MAFMFTPAKEAFFKGTLNLRTTPVAITPVEATPSPFTDTFGAISNKSTTGGGNSLTRQLTDIGGNVENRIVLAGSQINFQFEIEEYDALSTDTSAPILGWVLTAAAIPVSGSLPLLYIENVDANGVAAPFTPDGVSDLVLDMATYPVGVSEFGEGIYRGFLMDWLEGTVTPHDEPMGIALLESAPPDTLSTFADLSPYIALKPNSSPVVLPLSEFNGTIADRVTVVNEFAAYRFANPRFSSLETLSGDPVTHFTLYVGGGSPTGTERLVSINLINPAFTPDGVKSLKLILNTGVAIQL